MRARIFFTIFLGAAALALPAGCRGTPPPRSPDEVSGTFSIVAADPETGVCGAAVASRYTQV